ncbi:hypothetical protein KIN20_031053 [Parelaphostrongylus tenuis]|uniref:Uncharacterized protein n=1 Tax=Parelaphostrongylus tenuis TaxID=148309 RepID=A0AAD5R4K9_PARTN|nr:hypothetical protein KIN20_031053 [Parelaphostrongylus tenuis]
MSILFFLGLPIMKVVNRMTYITIENGAFGETRTHIPLYPGASALIRCTTDALFAHHSLYATTPLSVSRQPSTGLPRALREADRTSVLDMVSNEYRKA